jgi:hypothetical protein
VASPAIRTGASVIVSWPRRTPSTLTISSGPVAAAAGATSRSPLTTLTGDPGAPSSATTLDPTTPKPPIFSASRRDRSMP